MKKVDYTKLKPKQFPQIKFVSCTNCGKQGQLRIYKSMRKNMVIHEVKAVVTPFGIMPEITKSCMVEK